MAEPLRCDAPAPADHAQLYELLISELIDFAVFLIDPTGCIRSWNPGVERLLGFQENEWVGRPAHIIFTPEDRAAKKPEEEMTKAARDGRAPDIRWHQRKDGSRLFVEGTMVALKDEAGQLLGFSKVMRDITERKKTEERQAFLLRLSDALRPLRDPEAIKAAACRVLGEQLRVNRTFYAEVDGDDWVVADGYTQGVAPLPPGRYRADTYGHRIMETFRAGKQMVFYDARSDPGFSPAEREAHVAIKILGSGSVPLVKEGKLAAILTVHSAEPRNWIEDDMVLVEETAERTWAAVERARAEAALRASEAKYRTLFESMDEGFCIIQMLFDENGTAHDYRFLEANPAFEEQSGLRGAIGKTIRELVPSIEPSWVELYGQVALTGEPTRFDANVESMGRWFDIYAFRIGGAQERQMAVLFNDSTAKKAAEAERQRLLQEVQAERQRLGQVFARAPVAIAVFRGRDLVVEMANPPYQALLQGREVVGRRFADVMPDLGQEVWDVFHHVMDTGEPYAANEWHIPYDSDLDGVLEDHWFNVAFHPLREPDGTVFGFVSVLTEVTTQVRARQELERVNRGLEEFAHVASHDLQEPLRMVNSYSQLLVRRFDQEATDEQREFVGFIQHGVTRMEKLIRDLLSYSRTVHTVDERVRSEASLEESLGQALTAVDTRVAETGAVILHEPLPTVRGDTTQLAHVFQNLLSNALKYRKPERPPEVHINALQQEGQWVISVRDNGIGFDPHQAERIFGLFRRLHTEAEYPGTGLGLAICQRIVERYGGKIWAESKPGVGSTFFFSLPMVQA